MMKNVIAANFSLLAVLACMVVMSMAADARASGPSNQVTPGTVPDASTGVTAKAGNASATVSFTAPASDGGSPITSYIVTSSPGGITASGPHSPIIVKGLTNATAYTFTVQATNKIGTGPPDQVLPTK